MLLWGIYYSWSYIMQLFWNDELLDLCDTFKRLNGKHCHHPLLSNSTTRCHGCARVCFEKRPALADWGRSLCHMRWLCSWSQSTTPELAACFDGHCVTSVFDSIIRILVWLKSLLPKPWIWSLSVMKPIMPEQEPRGTAGTVWFCASVCTDFFF